MLKDGGRAIDAVEAAVRHMEARPGWGAVVCHDGNGMAGGRAGGGCGGSMYHALPVHCCQEDPVFDAGIGSVLNEDGEVEMDAMIMDGQTLDAGQW